VNTDGNVLLSLALALGIGLLIGVERERRKGHGPRRAFAGVRSFTLVALTGGLLQWLNETWLVAPAGLLVAALAVAAYWKDRSSDPGVTTEVAFFLTFVLGVLSIPHPEVAAGSAVLVAALLVARGPLQRFATHTLTEQELRNALVLASAALVVLPLTPDAPIPWLAGVNPRRIWQLVVVILAVQGAGDAALRWFGARMGLALSGLVSGLVSSTATIAALGGRARAHPELRTACVAGAWLSTVSTSAMLLALAALFGATALGWILPFIGAALLTSALLGAIAFWRSAATPEADATHQPAFSLRQALTLALIFTAIATAVAWLQSYWGDAATLAAAALAGFADPHATTSATIALAVQDKLSPHTLQLAVLIAFSSNTLAKMIAAFAAGSVAYGLRVSVGLALITLATWATWWMSSLGD
jgi:uncharacterized membrane protein (DUF4010 family)